MIFRQTWLLSRFDMIILLCLLVFAVFVPAASATIQCYDCHGSNTPPDYRPIDAPYRNITSGGFQGSHRKHMDLAARPETCVVCHPGSANYSTSHRNGLITVGLPGQAVYRNGSTAFPQRTIPRLGRCTNVTCHSDGTVVATGIPASSNPTPVWGSSEDSCSGCHAYPPNYGNGSPKKNAHGRHALYGLTCNRCHYATTTNGTLISNVAKHRNQQYDIAAPPGETLAYSFYPDGGTCTNTYCHSSAQGVGDPTSSPDYATIKSDPATTSGPNCTGCHKSGYRADNQVMTSGSHLKHLQFESGLVCNACHAYSGNIDSCAQCHFQGNYFDHPVQSARGANHVNGVIEVLFPSWWPAAGNSGTYTGDAVPRTPYGSCQNIYCHSQGTRGSAPFAPANIPTVQWGGQALPADCTGCHNGDAVSARPMATGSHSTHLRYNCDWCHAATVSGTRGIAPAPMTYPQYGGFYHMVTPIKHANGRVEVGFKNRSAALGGAYYAGSTDLYGNLYKVPGDAPGRCINTYCHSGGASVATGAAFGPLSTPVWGGTPLTCAGCHGYPPGYPDSAPKANGHPTHAANLCSSCHYTTSTDGSTIVNQALHPNSTYDLAAAPGTSFTYTFAPAGSSCANVSCHVSASQPRSWSTTPCGNCHLGVPDDQSHRKHFTGPAVAAVYGNASTSQQYLFNCGLCHPLDRARDNDGTVQVELFNSSAVAGSRKALNSALAHYTSGATRLLDSRNYPYTNGSCSNIYCHSNGTAVVAGQPPVSAAIAWNSGATSCVSCHDNPPAYQNGVPKANSHGSHAGQGCQVCHVSITADGTAIVDPLRHGDGVYDVAAGAGFGFSYGYGPTGGTCSAVACHADGTAVVTGQVRGALADLAWGGPSQTCTSCHGMPPAYPDGTPKRNAHPKHVGYGCSYCHYSVTATGTSIADRSRHGNGQYEVVPSAATSFVYAGGRCSATYCHSNGTSVITGQTPAHPYWGGQWSGTTTCESCHDYYQGGPQYPSGAPKANSHPQHWGVAWCQSCHYATTTDGSQISDPQRHANAQYDLAPAPGGASRSNRRCPAPGAARSPATMTGRQRSPGARLSLQSQQSGEPPWCAIAVMATLRRIRVAVPKRTVIRGRMPRLAVSPATSW